MKNLFLKIFIMALGYFSFTLPLYGADSTDVNVQVPNDDSIYDEMFCADDTNANLTTDFARKLFCADDTNANLTNSTHTEIEQVFTPEEVCNSLEYEQGFRIPLMRQPTPEETIKTQQIEAQKTKDIRRQCLDNIAGKYFNAQAVNFCGNLSTEDLMSPNLGLPTLYQARMSCLDKIADKSFDTLALKACNNYYYPTMSSSKYQGKMACLDIIANTHFSAEAVEVCYGLNKIDDFIKQEVNESKGIYDPQFPLYINFGTVKCLDFIIDKEFSGPMQMCSALRDEVRPQDNEYVYRQCLFNTSRQACGNIYNNPSQVQACMQDMTGRLYPTNVL